MIMLLGALAWGWLLLRPAPPMTGIKTGRRLVAAHGLTDLCLFTEARYTRHPSQADRHAAFQDHPGAREHFPSGALVPPPQSSLFPPHPRSGKAPLP